MIFRVNMTKTIEGEIYLHVRDEGELWDILNDELVEEDDVFWEDKCEILPVYLGDITPVRINSEGEYEEVFGDEEDDEFYYDDDYSDYDYYMGRIDPWSDGIDYD